MMSWVYQVLYHPGVNRIYRNILKLLLPGWRWKRKIPVSGNVRVAVAGKKMIVATNPTSFATKQIFWDGIDNFEYVPIFQKLIKKVKSFVDIGANTGIYSTMGCLVNPDLKAYSYEPSSGPYYFLEKNIAENNFKDRISPFQLALSNTSGEVDFFEVSNKKYKHLKHNLGGVGNLKNKISHRSMTTTKVRAITFDQHFDEIGGTAIDLIKIDTEATENLIIEGMSQSIEKYRPIIICETLYDRIEGEVEDLMIKHGYLFFNHIAEQNGLQKVDTLRRKSDNGVRDCFMVPPEKVKLIEEFVLS